MPGHRYDIRPLTEDDTDAAGTLGREAFGRPDDPAEPYRSPLAPGRHPFGAFDGGTLAARIVDREFDSWFGGVALPTAGIAGVAVAAEHRGGGLVAPLFDAALSGAVARGALVSGLFPTQPGIYRRLGYELVASFDTVRVPTAALAAVRRPDGVAVRRAGEGDAETLLDLYERWARAQNGPLTRRGASFPDPAAGLRSPTLEVSVAERDGVALGYAVWDRGQHYGEQATLAVTDLVAVEPDALRALLRTLGSFASVVPTTLIDTSGDDLARLLLAAVSWTVTSTNPYMIKVLDVPGTLSALRYPAVVDTVIDFAVAGDVLTGDGGYRLTIADGVGHCERESVPAAVTTFSPQGLAVVITGAQSCANARFAGLLSGPSDHDATLDAVFGGRQPHIRDYY